MNVGHADDANDYGDNQNKRRKLLIFGIAITLVAIAFWLDLKSKCSL